MPRLTLKETYNGSEEKSQEKSSEESEEEVVLRSKRGLGIPRLPPHLPPRKSSPFLVVRNQARPVRHGATLRVELPVNGGRHPQEILLPDLPRQDVSQPAVDPVELPHVA